MLVGKTIVTAIFTMDIYITEILLQCATIQKFCC